MGIILAVPEATGSTSGLEGRLRMRAQSHQDPTTAKDRVACPESGSEELRDYIDHLTTLNAKIAPDGTVLMANAVAAAVVGKSPDELAGKKLWQVPLLADSKQMQSRLRSAVKRAANRKSVRFEITHPTADGSEITVDFSLRPVLDDTGKLIYIVAEGRDISLRKQAEKKLQESEERYRNIFDNAPIAIFRSTVSGRVITLNTAGARMFGYKSADEMTRMVTDLGRDVFVDPEDRQRIVQEALKTTTFVRFENVYRRKDGSTFTASVYTRAVRTDGEVAFLEGFIEDVSERKRAEEALRQSREMLRIVLDTIPAGVFWKDRNSVYLGCNRFFAANAGLKSPDEVVGKTDFDLPWTRQESEAYREDDRRMIESGAPKLYYEETQYTADRGLTIVRTSKVPLRDGNGRIIGVLGTYEDITERKHAEEALRRSEQRYRTIVETAQEGVWLGNEAMQTVYVNQQFADMLGYTIEEMLGETPDEWVEPEDRSEMQEHLARRRRGISEKYDIRLRRKDGSHIWLMLSATPLIDQTGRVTGSVAMLSDITERRTLEEHKRDFYRRTILAATEGKLVVCEREDIEEAAGPVLFSRTVDEPQDVGEVRKTVAERASQTGMDKERIQDFVLCVGEITTNAIKHAGEGTVALHEMPEGLMAIVSDRGPGIPAVNLPEVALKKGYTTAVSLGMGYKTVISVADRVYLATGPEGTTVGVEMKLHPVPAVPLLGSLPDTWTR